MRILYRIGRFLNWVLLVAVLFLATLAAGQDALTISVEDTSVAEGDAGETTLAFTVTLSGTPSHRVRVQVTALLGVGNGGRTRGEGTATGVAGPKRDFMPFQTEIFFEKGASGAALTRTVNVRVIGDRRVEPDETVILRVNNLRTEDASVVLASGRKRIDVTGTIINDDQAGTATSSPAKPADFRAKAGDGRVTLIWSDPDSRTITRYEWRQRGGNNDWSEWTGIARSGVDTTSYIVKGLTNNMVYRFQVRAVNSIGSGAASDEKSATPNPGVLTISVEDASVAEGDAGETDLTFTVTLSGTPIDDVLVTAETLIKGGDTAMATPGAVTDEEVPVRDFVLLRKNVFFEKESTGGALAKTVIVKVLGDRTVEANETFTLRVRSLRTKDNRVVLAGGVKEIDVTGTIINDDQPGTSGGGRPLSQNPGSVTISPAVLTVEEGRSDSYTVVLDTQPTGDVMVTVGGASDDVALDKSSLTFTRLNWNVRQRVTVTGVRDEDTDNATATLTHSATGGGYGSVTIGSVMVSVLDTTPTLGSGGGGPLPPNPGSVTISPAVLTVEEGRSDSYTVVLDTQPTGDVMVTVSGASDDVALDKSSLTFTRLNWNVRQRVTVTGVRDEDTDNATATLTHSATGGGYGSVTIGSVTVSVLDTTPTLGSGGGGPLPPNPGSVTISPAVLAVVEGRSDSYTVVLDTQPTGDVMVTVGGASDDVTVDKSSLTFTRLNWNVRQRVTVTGVRDEDTDNAAATLTHSATGGGYGSVTIDSVTVSITDATPILTLVRDPDAVTEGMAIGLTVTSDKALAGALPVSLTLSDRDASGFTADDIPGSLGPRNFDVDFGAGASTSGTVTIPTSADDNVEGAETYTVTLNDVAGYAVGSDVTAEGVLKDGASSSAVRANRVNVAVLPQVVAALVSQTLEAVTGRVEAMAAGEAGCSLQFGAIPSPPRAAEWRDGLWTLKQTSPSLAEVLDGAAFTQVLGNAENCEEGALSTVVWGRGGLVSLSGSENGVSWDGGLWSAHLGADMRLRPDLRAGAALSRSTGDLDAEIGDGVKSVYEIELNAVHPYVAWLPADGLSLWASVGYGYGEVRIEEENAAPRSADLTVTNAATGGRSLLAEVPGLIPGGVTRLALKGEGSVARAKTKAADGLAALSVDAHRLRLALEGAHAHALPGGATLTPALEVGLRHDGGDTTEGAGAETGASLTWRHPAGLTAEVRARFLVAHEADREEWGVSALLRLDPGADGKGTFFTLAAARGGTDSGLARLFNRVPASPFAGGERAGNRFEAEVGHGFGLAGAAGLLAPYAGLTLAEEGKRAMRLGARYRLSDRANLGIEGARRESDTTDGENSLMLRGALRW